MNHFKSVLYHKTLSLSFFILLFGQAFSQTSTELNNQGLEKYKSRDYKAAILDFSKAIELNQQNEKAWHNRGLAKYGLKDFDGAIQDYNKAISLNAAYTNAYNDRALVYSKLKNYEGALQDYNKALLIDPAYVAAYNNRGNIRMILKDYDGALKDYSKSIELKPADAEGYIGRGNARFSLKDYKAAIPDFNKAIEFNPGSAMALLTRGNTKYLLKDDEGAILDFKKVVQLQPTNSNVYFNLGAIYSSHNRSREAISAYTQYNILEPKEWTGSKNIADIFYIQLTNFDSSSFYYKRAFQIKNNDKEIIERYGYSLLQLNRINEAVEVFKNLLTILPEDPTGYYNIGSAYSLGRKPAESLVYLGQALEKKMTDLDRWQKDKNLDNVRLLDDFRTLLKKYFTKDELAKYPLLFSFAGR